MLFALVALTHPVHSQSSCFPQLLKYAYEVRGVAAGLPVSYSTRHYDASPNYVHQLYMLDSRQAWSSLTSDGSQWIQVSAGASIVLWNSVILQGRADVDQWVTSYKVAFSNDGVNFYLYKNGLVVTGNTDRNTKVRFDFDCPVRARTLRIIPVTWVQHTSLRFDATFLQV